jgi:O-antigen biosynthesis protein
VTELRRVTLVESPRDAYRLNLVVPTVEGAGTFGGIRTALDLFEAIGQGTDERRIISVGRAGPDAAAAIPAYVPVAPGDDPAEARQQYVPLTRPFDGLAVRRNDVFVATYWTTAELVARIRRWQASKYGRAPELFGYVIQDFEPGFYPFSAQWLLARATYSGTDETVAMFNTSLLRDHFHGAGIAFEREFVFEPRLLPELRAAMARPPVPRERTILVYGRPGTPRNAFPAVVDGLRAWRAADPEADRWQVVSVGRDHPAIDLGGGMTMRSIGKLDLDAYAALLRESAIGISLMVSPHPSYPPLEMAHLGMLVLTNRFAAKDLATWHSNITAVDDISAEGLSSALTDLCRRFEADPEAGSHGRPSRDDFISDTPPFAFAADVATELRQGVPAASMASSAAR